MASTIDVRLSRATRQAEQKAYTIGTLVRSEAQYREMQDTFLSRGFGGDDCEYLIVNNCREDQWDAFTGLSEILNQAAGRHVILCHEDIRLLQDGRAALDIRLAELDALDPAWAVAGNAGGRADLAEVVRISDPYGENQSTNGPFPSRVMSVDENFMVVRQSSRVGFSRDMAGFHLYGADLCLNAEVRGYSSYVIDFHLRHLSAGRRDEAFWAGAEAFKAKWRRAFRARTMRTTCAILPMDGATESALAIQPGGPGCLVSEVADAGRPAN